MAGVNLGKKLLGLGSRRMVLRSWYGVSNWEITAQELQSRE